MKKIPDRKLDLIRNFGEIWKLKDTADPGADKIPKEKLMGYRDPANVLMVAPKLQSIRTMIEEKFEVSPTKVPLLEYPIIFREGDTLKATAEVAKKGELTEDTVKLSPTYLKILLKLCSNTKSSGVLFKFRKDYPLWAETEEMVVILAPRVYEE